MGRGTRRRGAALAGLAFCVLTGAARAEPVELRLFHAASPKSPAHTLFLKPWAQEIKARSKGRLEIVVEPRPSAETPDLLAALDDGRADLVWTAPGSVPGRYPASEVFELPFMAGSAEVASQAAEESLRGPLASEFADLHVILLHAGAPLWLHGAGTPMRRLEDLRGKTLYAPTSRIRAALAAWGAVPVTLAGPAEAAAALADGRIDGALLSFGEALPAGVAASARFHAAPGRPPGLFVTLYMLAMNKARYEALPDALKRVIDDSAGPALADRVGRTFDAVEKLDLKRGRVAGQVFYRLGDRELRRWRAAAQPAIDDWIAERDAAGEDGAALLAAARAAIARFEVLRETE
ncbi:MAG: hypothetical protein ACE5H8_06540 [Alphaproteobacteria bacterium]